MFLAQVLWTIQIKVYLLNISFHFEISYRVFIKYCVFSKILLYIPDSVFSRCQCVYTHQAGRTPALQQNRQSLKNSKNTIFNEHPVPMITCKVEPQPIVTNLFPHIRPHFLSQRSFGLVSDNICEDNISYYASTTSHHLRHCRQVE